VRINVRLDESLSRKLEALKKETGTTTSEVLRRAIDLYFSSVRDIPVEAVLTGTGFVGCGEGPADLSESYKEELAKDLKNKHDHR